METPQKMMLDMTEGIYKNNDRNIFEIPALLSSQRENPEQENS